MRDLPTDPDASARLHTRVLGLAVTHDGRHRGIPYLAFELGSARIGAAERPAPTTTVAPRPPLGVELVLETEDLAAEMARVADAGWPVDEDVTVRPWGLTDFRLVDPDGYYWRVTTGRPPAS